jgi:hypothetical protein
MNNSSWLASDFAESKWTTNQRRLSVYNMNLVVTLHAMLLDFRISPPKKIPSKQKYQRTSKFNYLEEFEDTKGVIRIRISKKNRQRNDQKYLLIKLSYIRPF